MSDGEICARHFATGQTVRTRWKNGVIIALEPAHGASSEWWIAPGLVDLQVNGYGGVDFQADDLTTADLLSAARQFHAAGGAQFLLTLITDDWKKLTTRLRHLKKVRDESAELKSVIAGWHIEGPFLSSEPGFHGAHNPTLMLDPTAAHIQELRGITGMDPLLLTLSPERTGALAAIALAKSLGIKISLGHTNASAKILRDAVQAGATGFTHLGNGCPQQLDRHDNILWRVFATPGLTVSLIPDRIHVSPTLFKLIHRLIEPGAIYYTTDAMAAAGAPPGPYRLGAIRVEAAADQVVREPGKPNFAGSALRPVDGIFRAAEMLDCPWPVAWQRMSLAPTKFMGLRNGLESGEPANFCLLKLDASQRLQELKMINEATR
jgi:N-acetylglucosamine-6-phosphate deacetylase